MSVIKADIGGCDVVGIFDGFKWPMEESTVQLRARPIKERSRQSYQIESRCMIRLSDEDFKDPVVLGQDAALAGLSPEAFQQRFQQVGLNAMGTPAKGCAPWMCL